MDDTENNTMATQKGDTRLRQVYIHAITHAFSTGASQHMTVKVCHLQNVRYSKVSVLLYPARSEPPSLGPVSSPGSYRAYLTLG